jgi:hypothetical protein
MLITLRLPRSSASKLGLPIAGIAQHEVVLTLTAVELAGRLSLATGKAIRPEAVVGYCVAWRAASESLERLVKKHGKTGLPRIVRKACKDRALWAPSRNAAMLNWLKCVLEAYFLSGANRGRTTPRPGAHATGLPEAYDSTLAQEPDIAQTLADICESNFPLAYRLWTATVEGAAGTTVPRPIK